MKPRNPKKRYTLVGTGARSNMYISALLESHADVGELVALCDANQTRMNYYINKAIEKSGKPLPTYRHSEFDRMIAETQPDAVIVTTTDNTHHHYITRAMELGCDAVTEKPITVDVQKCQQIIDVVHRTGKNLRVTFNARYSPRNSKVKEILQAGEIGEVLSIHFEELLDTQHGADYFRRWHRNKQNSGGLMVHKSTHHFDLVNWWLDSSPETVFGIGDLRFYGRENAENRGITQFYTRAHGSETARQDPFAIDLEADPKLRELYLQAEHEDGYIRDQSVFGDDISIEDTMAVIVHYRNKAIMTYSLNAHCPWEGDRIMFNGTKGRLEVESVKRAHLSIDNDKNDDSTMQELSVDPSFQTTNPAPLISSRPAIILQKHWGQAREVTFEEAKGDHGGGDIRLLDDLFRGAGQDPLGRAADYMDGVNSLLTGIAANVSFESGQPVRVADLVRLN